MKKLGAACLAALLVAACFSGTDSGDDTAADADTATVPAPAAPSPGPDVLAVDATLSEWKIELTRDSVPAGVVTINIRNSGTVPHALQITGSGQDMSTDRLAPGANVSMSLDLLAGEYKLHCPVDSAGVKHETRGMVTRLRVY